MGRRIFFGQPTAGAAAYDISNLGAIASGEAFGSPAISLDVSPSGIASAEAFGTPSVSLDVQHAGIPSEEAFGTPTIAPALPPIDISDLGGVASAEAFGTPSFALSLGFVGIPSEEAFGNPILELTLALQGILSAEAFGNAAISLNVDFVGIASEEAFGIPTFQPYVEPGFEIGGKPMNLLNQLVGRKVLVLGFNGAIANAEEDLWDASQDWAPFASAVTLDVSSGSAADAAAGTGARTQRLIGLDADGKLQTEDVTLNGQTAVVSTKAYLRLLGAEVLTVGSGGKNAGIIYIADSVVTQTAGVPSDLTKLVGWIAIGMNRTMSGFYTIPVGAGSYKLKQLYLTARTQIVTYYLLTRTNGGIWVYQMLFTLAAGSDRDHRPEYEFTFAERTDLKIRAIAAVSGGVGSAHMALEKIPG